MCVCVCAGFLAHQCVSGHLAGNHVSNVVDRITGMKGHILAGHSAATCGAGIVEGIHFRDGAVQKSIISNVRVKEPILIDLHKHNLSR